MLSLIYSTENFENELELLKKEPVFGIFSFIALGSLTEIIFLSPADGSLYLHSDRERQAGKRQ